MSSSFWGPAIRHTVFITGGASGIGLALAKRISAGGHTVIVAGRRQAQLELAQTEVPALKVIQGDVSSEEGRRELAKKVFELHPDCNVLINNAGIQNRLPPFTDPTHGEAAWARHKEEIAINFDAPIHMSFLFIPHFLSKPTSQIVNVTSGLAFIPMASMVYDIMINQTLFFCFIIHILKSIFKFHL